MKPSRSFASDNNAVVHPEALEAIERANQGHVVGYGDKSSSYLTAPQPTH